MAPPKPTKKPKGQKKEKVFHPLSRKADQLVRTQLRKGKLADLAKARNQKHHKQVDLYGFFYHAIPPEGTLTLEDVHTIIHDIWLPRFDSELEAERAARRKGRPKKVIDLTHPLNVDLFRQWDQKEAPFIEQLRFIRISSAAPDVAQVSRPGKHPLLIEEKKSTETQAQDMDMDDSEAPLLLEPMTRFSSTTTTMGAAP
ncbi:unnamed protein product [Somion occarium]|uniref:Translation machinery-associated protein 16 n=1 Tax=Somion occarium TaxID=3059160 RepID=A0ABP1E3X2_9APHY